MSDNTLTARERMAVSRAALGTLREWYQCADQIAATWPDWTEEQVQAELNRWVDCTISCATYDEISRYVRAFLAELPAGTMNAVKRALGAGWPDQFGSMYIMELIGLGVGFYDCDRLPKPLRNLLSDKVGYRELTLFRKGRFLLMEG